MAWRAQLIVERTKNKNGELWLVTVRDETLKLDLVTATAKELDGGGSVIQLRMKGAAKEPLPLQRINASSPGGPQAPLNKWERLRMSQFGPDPEFDFEEPKS